MPNKRISELPVGAALTGTELMEAVQAGTNIQVTSQSIANLSGAAALVSTLKKAINQTAHGFIVGNVITIDLAGNYVPVSNAKAQEIVGIVIVVTDANNFTICIDGYLELGSGGIVAGVKFYATDTGIYSQYPLSLDDKVLFIGLSFFTGYMARDGVVPLPADTSWKNPVDVATTANITLSGEQVIDGILTAASRVLVKDQSTPALNGLYNSNAGAWTRTTDADAGSELEGAAVNVLTGTVNHDKNFVQISDNVTLGTTAIIWAEIGSSTVVPPASSTVPGIAKLYPSTGSNTDGAITQLGTTTALNLKSNRLWTITTKTGSYTLAAAELTALSTGTSLVMEGNGTGDLTIPPNSTVAFSIGDNMAVRAFLNVIAGAGVTVTGTNGTLIIPTNRTVILEKIGTNNWLLHNGSAMVTTWSVVEAGIVEESTQAEAEQVISGANTGTTGGLSQGRTPSEIGLYFFIRKFVTLAWSWTLQQTFAIGPIITDATANTPAWFNASKKLVSGVATDILDYAGISPVSVAVSLVSTTITLDCATKYSRKWYTSTAHTANFTLTKTNKTLVEYGHYVFQVTGTIVIQLDSDDRMPDDMPGWNLASKQLTLTSGGTGLLYSIAFTKMPGNYFLLTCSTKSTV